MNFSCVFLIINVYNYATVCPAEGPESRYPSGGREARPGAAATTGIAPQVAAAPQRVEGEGPLGRLILRGATLIDGTGAPPFGPVDIVVEGNRVLELEGHYVLPGFVDLHGHLGGSAQGTPAEYVLKLWMGHGITTSADPGSGNGIGWMLEHKARAERNEITAPRLLPSASFGQGWEEPITTAEQARAWVDEIADVGAHGIKFFGLRPDIMEAASPRPASAASTRPCTTPSSTSPG